MKSQPRYSLIACPACGKTFRFWDTFENVPTGKLLKCPKCQCMFAFTVPQYDEPEDIRTQAEKAYTADVEDKGAYEKFLNEMEERLMPIKKPDEPRRGSKGKESDSVEELPLAEVPRILPESENIKNPNE